MTTAITTPLRRWLLLHDACPEGLDWLPADAEPQWCWQHAPPEYLIWAATRSGVLDDATLRRFSRWCASQALHLWDAPAVVRQYLETGDEALRAAAGAAAWAAAGAAAGAAAWAAAWAAARAAAGAAAGDAAWAAARAAAYAAARAAAGDAAGDVAYAAARAAAGDAAGDVAWAAQAAWLREHARPDWSVIERS